MNADSQPASWRELFGSKGMLLLAVYCLGVWLFAADGLMVATMMPALVPELGGAELIGWAGALFQAISIVAGAFSVFLVRRFRISSSFLAAVAGLLAGCLISAFATDMWIFQVGRLFQAYCGGVLVSLAHIGVTQIMPSRFRVRAFALLSVVWGVAAFGAPLLGAVFVSTIGWRAAFIYAAIFALLVGIASIAAHRLAPRDSVSEREGRDEPFPLVRMIYLTLGVAAIATASLVSSLQITIALIILGLALSALFAQRDAQAGTFALMPKGSFDPRLPIGSLLYFIFFAGAATVAMGVFGPLILEAAFGLEPIYIGYLLFLAAGGWTLMATLLSSVPPHREPQVIRWAAFVIVASSPVVALGFLLENVWLVALGVFADGAGFGACWGLLFRRATQHSDQFENERISSSINNVQRAGLAFGSAFLSILVNGMHFDDMQTTAQGLEIGFWMMAISGLIGLPALWAAWRFANVPEHQIHVPVDMSPAPAPS